MIVAINKNDKPEARAQRVREELLQHEIVVEDLGGDVQDVEVSALKKTNLDKLLKRSASRPNCSSSRPIRTAPPKAPWSRPSSTRAAARSPPCSSSAGR